SRPLVDLPSFPTRRSSDLRRWNWLSARRTRLKRKTERGKRKKTEILYYVLRFTFYFLTFYARHYPCRVPVPPWRRRLRRMGMARSEEHTSELQSRFDLVCR